MRNIQYYYTLNEEEDGWIPLRNNYVNLANLAPGNYELKVTARSADGSYSDTKIARFKINPQVWKSKEAILVYIIIIIFFIIKTQ